MKPFGERVCRGCSAPLPPRPEHPLPRCAACHKVWRNLSWKLREARKPKTPKVPRRPISDMDLFPDQCLHGFWTKKPCPRDAEWVSRSTPDSQWRACSEHRLQDDTVPFSLARSRQLSGEDLLG